MAAGASAGFAPWSVLTPPAGTCVQPYVLDPCAFLQGARAALSLHPSWPPAGNDQWWSFPYRLSLRNLEVGLHSILLWDGCIQPSGSQGELLLGSWIIKCF